MNAIVIGVAFNASKFSTFNEDQTFSGKRGRNTGQREIEGSSRPHESPSTQRKKARKSPSGPWSFQTLANKQLSVQPGCAIRRQPPPIRRLEAVLHPNEQP